MIEFGHRLGSNARCSAPLSQDRQASHRRQPNTVELVTLRIEQGIVTRSASEGSKVNECLTFTSNPSPRWRFGLRCHRHYFHGIGRQPAADALDSNDRLLPDEV